MADNILLLDGRYSCRHLPNLVANLKQLTLQPHNLFAQSRFVRTLVEHLSVAGYLLCRRVFTRLERLLLPQELHILFVLFQTGNARLLSPHSRDAPQQGKD